MLPETLAFILANSISDQTQKKLNMNTGSRGDVTSINNNINFYGPVSIS